MEKKEYIFGEHKLLYLIDDDRHVSLWLLPRQMNGTVKEPGFGKQSPSASGPITTGSGKRAVWYICICGTTAVGFPAE